MAQNANGIMCYQVMICDSTNDLKIVSISLCVFILLSWYNLLKNSLDLSSLYNKAKPLWEFCHRTYPKRGEEEQQAIMPLLELKLERRSFMHSANQSHLA